MIGGDLIRRLLLLPEQASTFAPRVDALHVFIILTTFVVGTAIAAVTLTFLVRYRRRSEDDVTHHVVAPTWLEGIFVTVSLSFFLWFFVIGFEDFVWAHQPPEDAMDVYVTGKQWMWKFSHADGPSSIDVLYVPTGRPVRLLLISRDVIHSFFVPAFRIKQDAVPGRYTQIWFEVSHPGTYELLCAEYCGLNHSRMRGAVVALEPEAFERWRLDSTGEEGGTDGGERSLRDRGEGVAVRKGCFNCHTIDGTPHIGPSWSGLYLSEVRLTTGEVVTADVGYLTESMMAPRAKVVAGFDPVMPSFEADLSAGETAALVEFIRSLRRKGVSIQEPADEPAAQ